MTCTLSKSVISKAQRKCPFLTAIRYLGIHRVLNKFEKFFYLCPYMRKTITTINVPSKEIATNYDEIFENKVREKQKTNTYRVFNRIGRLANNFATAEAYPTDLDIKSLKKSKNVAVWCSNDYLGMSCNARVIEAALSAVQKYGVGAGGTRNISGNNVIHEKLEKTLADWYRKEAGLVFTSCYVANSTTLSTLGKLIPDCVIFSDEGNHASMIEGVRYSRCQKVIYKHNDIEDLEVQLSKFDISRPKIVAFESVYSMSGSVAPIKDICDLSHKYGAITFLDEVHAVGLYGEYGSGLSEHFNCLDGVDVISGTLGKAVGTIGGFIVGKSSLIDTIRCYGPGFIFTTSLPPCIASSSIESINILQSKEGQLLRKKHQTVVSDVRKKIAQLGIPLFPSVSHILPLFVGDSQICNNISRHMMNDYDVYVQSINYPTVKFGTERIRIAPTPGHGMDCINHLLNSLSKTWDRVGLKPQHPICTNQSCDCTHTCTSYEDKRITIPFNL